MAEGFEETLRQMFRSHRQTRQLQEEELRLLKEEEHDREFARIASKALRDIHDVLLRAEATLRAEGARVEVVLKEARLPGNTETDVEEVELTYRLDANTGVFLRYQVQPRYGDIRVTSGSRRALGHYEPDPYESIVERVILQKEMQPIDLARIEGDVTEFFEGVLAGEF